MFITSFAVFASRMNLRTCLLCRSFFTYNLKLGTYNFPARDSPDCRLMLGW
jgi:hypothetical protein